jgi:hypothetical protein
MSYAAMPPAGSKIDTDRFSTLQTVVSLARAAAAGA